MTDPTTDDLSPTDKDAAEGQRGPDRGAQPTPPKAREEGHLGAAGDPAEGNTGDGSEPGP